MRQCPARAILIAWNDETDILTASMTLVRKLTLEAPEPGIAWGLTPVRAIPAIACSRVAEHCLAQRDAAEVRAAVAIAG